MLLFYATVLYFIGQGNLVVVIPFLTTECQCLSEQNVFRFPQVPLCVLCLAFTLIW